MSFLLRDSSAMLTYVPLDMVDRRDCFFVPKSMFPDNLAEPCKATITMLSFVAAVAAAAKWGRQESGT